MRRALLIGINYYGMSCELHGCINDTINMKNYLKTTYGLADNEIIMMSDAPGTAENLRPTRANVIEHMRKLVEGCTSQSRLFLHYSGHGGSTRDKNGDEVDGMDETIYPIDGVIVDDDLRTLLVKPLKSGSKLTCVFDCCHSGTALDLRYNHKVIINGTQESYTTVIEKNEPDSEGDVCLISGCLDSQTSADSFEAKQAQGAMTYSLLETLKLKKNDLSYRSLIKNLDVFIKAKGYEQIPQLSTGRAIDVNSKFTIF
jgi:hypothetical protein